MQAKTIILHCSIIFFIKTKPNEETPPAENIDADGVETNGQRQTSQTLALIVFFIHRALC